MVNCRRSPPVLGGEPGAGRSADTVWFVARESAAIVLERVGNPGGPV